LIERISRKIQYRQNLVLKISISAMSDIKKCTIFATLFSIIESFKFNVYMKKLFILISVITISMSLFAKEPSMAELVIQMNTAQRDGDYLGALVAATAILKLDNNHRIAKEFVHTNYQRMDQQAKERIGEIAFSEDAAELEEICEIYRKLSDINDNLSEVEMPLKGGNKITGEWSWQPEIQYYRGHYDKARTKVFDLYKRVGKAAIMEDNVDAAYFYFKKALNTYLMNEEYNSQFSNLIDQCNQSAQFDAQSRKTEHLIRSYNTYTLIARLDSLQDVSKQQNQLKPLIADAYVRDAEKLLSSDLVTDWESAYENYQTALDWNTEASFVKSISTQADELRKQIASYYRKQGLEELAKQWEKEHK